MLHTKTVEPGTLDLIKRLSQDPALENFVLAGGTALSLQLGHRKSIDLDFFSVSPFNYREVGKYLTDNHKASEIVASRNTVHMHIGDVRTSFIAHQYPQVSAN